MNKQIEEMAKFLCSLDTYDHEKCEKCGKWDRGTCDELCFSHEVAIDLYNANYRKQIVGEWVRQNRMVDGKVRAEAVCSNCGTDVVYQAIDNRWQFENFCPHCGANMKGVL